MGGALAQLMVLALLSACLGPGVALYARTNSVVCPNGMFVGGICQPCKLNCTSCTVPGGCSTCDSLNYVLRNSSCLVSDSYLDTDAFNAYRSNYLINETFYCSAGCVANGAFICTSCLPGSRLSQGFCEACTVLNCKSCALSKVTESPIN